MQEASGDTGNTTSMSQHPLELLSNYPKSSRSLEVSLKYIESHFETLRKYPHPFLTTRSDCFVDLNPDEIHITVPVDMILLYTTGRMCHSFVKGSIDSAYSSTRRSKILPKTIIFLGFHCCKIGSV